MLDDQNIVIKHTKTNGTLEIYPVSRREAKHWIVTKHYSKTWNSAFGTINFGIFRDNELLGVAVYGNLMNPASHNTISDYGSDSILELNRLHIDDTLGHNAETTFLGATFKLIKRMKPEVKFIHTFADGRLGCGTIYKAANFQYCGYHETEFYQHIEKLDFYHTAPFSNTMRPSSMLKLNRWLLNNVLRLVSVKTYRYIYNLYPKKFKNKLPNLPYPAYNIGMVESESQIISSSLLARLYLMYSMIDDTKYTNLAMSELSIRHSPKEIDDLIDQQRCNESFKKFIKKEIGKNGRIKKNAMMRLKEAENTVDLSTLL